MENCYNFSSLKFNLNFFLYLMQKILWKLDIFHSACLGYQEAELADVWL